MAKKKTAGKPAKKAAVKKAVAPAPATPPPPTKLTFATINDGQLIAEFDNNKTVTLPVNLVHPLHAHFVPNVDIIDNKLVIPIKGHLLKMSAAQLLDLSKPISPDGYEAHMQNFDALLKIYENFNYFLKDIMKQRKINQAQLAEIVGIHFADVSHYVKNETKPKIPRFYQILLALKIDPRKL